MSKDDPRVIGEINGVQIVEGPLDHAFAGTVDGDQPDERRITCACGWRSASGPEQLLDLDVHFAEVNGISYEEQKQRTTETMRRLMGEKSAWPDPKPTN
jgi:hypothetical protein